MSSNTLEKLVLPRTLINQLLTHAQRGDENEVCGFIASRGGKPTRTYAIKNVAMQATRRFEMEPAAQIRAIKEMREQGEALFAIYHSHPTSPAAPSQIDIDEFSYPDALSLIISLSTQGVLEIRAYRMMKNCATEVAIETGSS